MLKFIEDIIIILIYLFKILILGVLFFFWLLIWAMIAMNFIVIFYIPIPFSNIAGFTYKQFGIIFLNSKEPPKRNLHPNKYFLKKICSISFKKVVTIHEIIGHYYATLVHGNDSNYDLNTPDNTLIDYVPKDEYKYIYSLFDGGERGESILFGNKIQNISKVLYIY